MRSFKTTKGTELPLLNLRGREYLEVKYRLVWFREDHPDWSIETELISVTDVSAYARATIRDDKGRIIATSHKFESIQGFPDFIEKAETGAIGRALALIGYGTQFCADELDEGSRIVDAPVPPRLARNRAGQDGNVQPGLSTRFDRNETAPSEEESPSHEEAVSGDEPQPANPGDFVVSFGRKYKGRRIKDIPRGELESYLQWMEEKGAVRPGTPLANQVHVLRNAVERFNYEAGAVPSSPTH